MNFKVTINKPKIDTQKIKRKVFKHNTKDIIKSQESKIKKWNREELQKTQKIMNKMAISTYLSVIIINVHVLNVSIK